MSETIYRISGILSSLVSGVPVGTNLGLAYLAWMIMSGRLLSSRGAVIPGLAEMGMPTEEVRRSWAALWGGKWEIAKLLENWRSVVEADGTWKAREYEGWKTVAVDLTAYYRPRLQGLQTKHYNSQAGKALPAIPLGLAVRVGEIGGRRVGMPAVIQRMPAGESDEMILQTELLRAVGGQMSAEELVVADAGFKLSQLRSAGVDAFVLRMAKNFTARRNELPAYKGRGRPPEYGEIVRPLARVRDGKIIEAGVPDRQETFAEGGHIIRAEYWDELVGREEKVGAAASFTCVVITDPRYAEPLVLTTTTPLSGEQLKRIYRDRWSVEVPPLHAKQVLGAQRQFVFAETSRHRLPELSLLLGSVLEYVAVTHTEAIPTGFWDRKPEPTIGRFRRLLRQVHFSDLAGFTPQVRKKSSRTDHLPKGVAGHRRTKQPSAPTGPAEQAA